MLARSMEATVGSEVKTMERIWVLCCCCAAERTALCLSVRGAAQGKQSTKSRLPAPAPSQAVPLAAVWPCCSDATEADRRL